LPPPVVCTPETVQSLAAADFNVTFQAENTTATIVADGAAIIRVTNPDFDNAINKSCQVGKITRDAAFNTQTISLILLQDLILLLKPVQN
jgi:hypothetical protein